MSGFVRRVGQSHRFASLRGRGKRVILAHNGIRRLIPGPPIQSANGDLVTHSLLSRHAAVIGAAVALSLPSALAAQAPTQQELLRDNAAGNYLAARHAGVERDAAAAAAYYLNVLKSDPHNTDLLSRAFLSVLTEGDVDEAAKLADKLVQVDQTDRIARLVIGVRALKQKQYSSARQNFSQSVRGPVTDLTATLLSAWALYGAGDTRAAIDTMDKLAGPDWYGIFKDLHAGMILDLANNKKEAGKRYERAYKADPTALRTVQAYGRYLSRNGSKDDALKVYQDFNKALPDHPLIKEEMKARLGRRQAAAAGRFGAGRRRRSALRARRLDRAARRRRSGADLSAACALSRAVASDGAAFARRPLRVAEKARSGDQGLRTGSADVAAVSQRRNPARRRPRSARSHRRSQEAARTRHRRASEGHRSAARARQYSARAQGVRRMRRCLWQGHRHGAQAGKVELGDVLLPRHLLRALAPMAEAPKPI